MTLPYSKCVEYTLENLLVPHSTTRRRILFLTNLSLNETPLYNLSVDILLEDIARTELGIGTTPLAVEGKNKICKAMVHNMKE